MREEKTGIYSIKKRKYRSFLYRKVNDSKDTNSPAQKSVRTGKPL